jgi:heme/copper-type cytochrome/quinol oxidase subunit 2
VSLILEKMFPQLLIIAQTSDKLSWKVWAGAAFFLLLGIALFIYFLTRLRKSDQETEEDWSLSRSSLFTDTVPKVVSAGASSQTATCPACHQPIDPQTQLCQSCGFKLTKAAEVPPATSPVEVKQATQPDQETDAGSRVEVKQATQPEMTLHNQIEATVGEQSAQEEFTSPFGDEIWAELERYQEAARADARSKQEPLQIEVLTPQKQHETEVPRILSSESALERPMPPGSVLGLSATRPSEPIASADMTSGISSLPMRTLSNYGRDESEKAGPWGTIALVAAVILIAVAVLTFLFVPSVNSRVKAWVARVRGSSEAPTIPMQEKPKAQIISRSEAKQNRVKVKGAVLNRSSEALAGLFVEVALERSDGAPPDTRSVSVKPERLAPLQQGSFELEYDAKQYNGYKVKRLINKDGSEIKFIAPGL